MTCWMCFGGKYHYPAPYQTNSYLCRFEAQLLASDEGGVVLDQVAFYPDGGGQPPDIGRSLMRTAGAPRNGNRTQVRRTFQAPP